MSTYCECSHGPKRSVLLSIDDGAVLGVVCGICELPINIAAVNVHAADLPVTMIRHTEKYDDGSERIWFEVKP